MDVESVVVVVAFVSTDITQFNVYIHVTGGQSRWSIHALRVQTDTQTHRPHYNYIFNS